MKKGTFEGTSTNGSIEEAVAKAILLAKNKLKVDFIIWNLDTIVGANGGLVHSNIVTVSIKAKGVNVKKIKEKEEKIKEKEVKKNKKEKDSVKKAKPISATEKTKELKLKATKEMKPKAIPAKKATSTKKATPKK